MSKKNGLYNQVVHVKYIKIFLDPKQLDMNA